MAAKKRKKARSAKQKAATRALVQRNKAKAKGPAAKPARRRKRRKATAAAPAAKKTRRGSSKRKGHRAWNKGKKFHKTRKRISGYARKPTVGGHQRWVNPKRRRRGRRRNPSGGFKQHAMTVGVALLGGGAALIATQHAEPMIPLSGYGLALAEVAAGIGLGILGAMLSPAFGAGIAVGIGGSGVKHGLDELMGPPAASGTAAPKQLQQGSMQQLFMAPAAMRAIDVSAIDMDAVEDDVDAVDLQMGAVDLGCCDEGCGEDDDDDFVVDYSQDESQDVEDDERGDVEDAA